MNFISQRITLPKDPRTRLLIGAGVIVTAVVLYSEYQVNIARPAKMIEQLCDYRDSIEEARHGDGLRALILERGEFFAERLVDQTTADKDVTAMLKHMRDICEGSAPERE